MTHKENYNIGHLCSILLHDIDLVQCAIYLITGSIVLELSIHVYPSLRKETTHRKVPAKYHFIHVDLVCMPLSHV